MTGFKPGSSGIASDRSANCATTTFLLLNVWLTFDISKIGHTRYPLANFQLFDLTNFKQTNASILNEELIDPCLRLIKLGTW